MKLTEILHQNKLTLSFEVFPPKTDSAFDSVKGATEEIARLSPAFMSVTYGAGGGTSQYTLDIAQNIREKYNVPTLAHLTCVSSTRETVKEKIEQIHAAGIENIMALRGDIPADRQGEDRNMWDYRHAAELIRDLKESGYDFCIGGACYPETHPESESATKDIEYLKVKVDHGCEFLTTQMFFDNNILYNFMYRLLRAGVDVPVVAGIMPVTNASQIKMICAISGNTLPQKFLRIVDRFEHDPQALKQADIAFATEQIIDLFANGINAVHVYSMNNPEVARQIQSNLSEIII